MEQENKRTFKMPLIVLVIIVLAVIIGGVLYVNTKNNPKNIFLGAVDSLLESSETKQEEIKTMNVTMGLGVNINSDIEEVNKVAKYLNKAKITFNAQADIEQEREFIKLGLDYENEKVLDAKISYKNQEDKIYAKVEELFDKCFSIEVDEEIRTQLKTLFDEAKNLSKGEVEKTEKLAKVLKEIIKDRLLDEYFSKESVELDINGETEKVKKSTLTLTPTQLKELLKGVSSDLRESEDFMNCFEDEDKETVKKALTDFESSINSIDSGAKEGDGIKFNLYTKGMKNEFIKFEMIVLSSADEMVISVLKNDKENYKFVISEKIDGQTSEIVNSTITIKNVNDTATDLTVKVNVEEVGEVAVNLQFAYVINQPIENLDTTNSVNLEEVSELDQQTIMTNLQKMKIYKIVNEIIAEFSSPMTQVTPSVPSSPIQPDTTIVPDIQLDTNTTVDPSISTESNTLVQNYVYNY